jgi:hypothetical protein
VSAHGQLRFSVSWRILAAKEKPTARSLLAVGSGDSLKSALLHPIPSSRRHVVIRVDMPVPVDVIRVSFWMMFVMKFAIADNNDSYQLRLSNRAAQEKLKIPIVSINFLDSRGNPQGN